MSRFRLAAAPDAGQLVELIRSAYRGEESRDGWTSEADLVEGDRISAGQVRAIIDGPSSMMLVLEDDSGIIACCQLEDRGGNVVYFGTFAVSPLTQGRGFGRRLMAEAERRAVAAFGARLMEMTVLERQRKLIAWYERLGFSPTGETRPFPADPVFARPLHDDLRFIVLSKNLVSPSDGAASGPSSTATCRDGT
jgi:ribosomal protein S18 acetylase RimI-like enzyme